MDYVLTGYRGLIGSALNKILAAGYNNPVILTDLRAGTDTRKIHEYKIFPDEKIDVVYHLSAFCSIRDCIQRPEWAFEHNVRATDKVLEFCRINNVPKIVFTSSSRVLYPEKNPYTASKIYGEELVKGYSQAYGIDYTIVRPSTVYGGFNDITGRLIHKWMNAVLKGEPLIIYGDENKSLDFTYVDDFVAGLLHAQNFKNSEWNISYGTETKLVDVANYIIELHGKGKIEFRDAEPTQPQQVCVNTDVPCSTGIEEGLKKTYEWYRRNAISIRMDRLCDVDERPYLGLDTWHSG